MKRKLLVAALALVAALSVLTIAGCSCSSQQSSSGSSSGQVETPNLVWLEMSDAETLLNESGLKLGDVTYEFSDTVPEGLVISQTPEAMKKVEAGSTVTITVSKGKEAPVETTVPNLISMTQTEAENAIAQANLVAVQGEPVVTNDVAPGLLCQQSIAAGTIVDEGTQIVISTAIADGNVEVPNLVGEPYTGASDALTNLGLGCDKATAYSDTVDEGLVISQSVDFGTSVAKGTVVTLTVSLGPAPVSKITVPDCYTYTLSDAQTAIESCGLVCRYTGDLNGTVVAMSPDAGTEVEAGSTVTIFLQGMLLEA